MANVPGEASGFQSVMHVGTVVALIKDPAFFLPQSADRNKLSIGTQKGPLIGVQKGPRRIGLCR
jgi:hypothetical protein